MRKCITILIVLLTVAIPATAGLSSRSSGAAEQDSEGEMILAKTNMNSDSVVTPARPTCCTGETMGNYDCTGIIDIGDVTRMIQELFIVVGPPPCCFDESDLDYSGLIDIGDLTMLIRSLWVTLEPLPPCPR